MKQRTLQSRFQPVYLAEFSSQLPDPRNVREAMAAPDADGWKDAMTKEMNNLKSHDVYELMLHTPGMRTLRLGWILHRKFKIVGM